MTMAVGEGKFVLYSRIEPPLEAGDYRFTASQDLSANAAGSLPVDELATHVRVRSPRYLLPPDQVLSTFPPAMSEGAYGGRLPQVVIRRRTLPWERSVEPGVARSTPWLALVLIAEGEAELKLNQPVADCVTPGTTLPGIADIELGNSLQIRQSMVNKIFPTRLDVPLLAHAREVDIHDTELLMGDDDGFLAVVIANRLPVAGRDADGHEVPVKYLACLVNLEGQFTRLLERAPEPASTSDFGVGGSATVHAAIADWDHARMGRYLPAPGPPHIGPQAGPGPAAASAQYAGWSSEVGRSGSDVYAEMARAFTDVAAIGERGATITVADPLLRFPALLHWSFTSYGDTTFRKLIEGLDSGLLGTLPAEPGDDPPPGTPVDPAPREIVETGHVGLAHRVRRGDAVRSWYRGPLVPHPTVDPPGGRLPLAHAADQLRIVVPDGREDVSLAGAFEIGRLLALARPSMVAALMRWRQNGYQQARRDVLWSAIGDFLDDVLLEAVDIHLVDRVGVLLGRSLVDAVVRRPEDFVGNPSPLVTPGVAPPIDGPPEAVMAEGFGLPVDLLRREPSSLLTALRDVDAVRAAPMSVNATEVRATLSSVLDDRVVRLTDDVTGATARPGAPVVLDRLLDRLADIEDSEDFEEDER
jgi:hypothetical protein